MVASCTSQGRQLAEPPVSWCAGIGRAAAAAGKGKQPQGRIPASKGCPTTHERTKQEKTGAAGRQRNHLCGRQLVLAAVQQLPQPRHQATGLLSCISAASRQVPPCT